MILYGVVLITRVDFSPQSVIPLVRWCVGFSEALYIISECALRGLWLYAWRLRDHIVRCPLSKPIGKRRQLLALLETERSSCRHGGKKDPHQRGDRMLLLNRLDDYVLK